MTRASIVFSKDRMVNDCCSHVFVLCAELGRGQSSKHKVSSTRHKGQSALCLNPRLRRRTILKQAPPNSSIFLLISGFINLGIVFANAEAKDQGQRAGPGVQGGRNEKVTRLNNRIDLASRNGNARLRRRTNTSPSIQIWPQGTHCRDHRRWRWCRRFDSRKERRSDRSRRRGVICIQSACGKAAF